MKATPRRIVNGRRGTLSAWVCRIVHEAARSRRKGRKLEVGEQLEAPASVALHRVDRGSETPVRPRPRKARQQGSVARGGARWPRVNQLNRRLQMRIRLSYANVAATLALVFSMTGGAMAANHYLVESTEDDLDLGAQEAEEAISTTPPAGTARTGAPPPPLSPSQRRPRRRQRGRHPRRRRSSKMPPAASAEHARAAPSTDRRGRLCRRRSLPRRHRLRRSATELIRPGSGVAADAGANSPSAPEPPPPPATRSDLRATRTLPVAGRAHRRHRRRPGAAPLAPPLNPPTSSSAVAADLEVQSHPG